MTREEAIRDTDLKILKEELRLFIDEIHTWDYEPSKQDIVGVVSKISDKCLDKDLTEVLDWFCMWLK
jgi:hypothetical protein